MATAAKAKPQNYDELYPGRFLKAGQFKGKQVTLTIADVFTEGLASTDEDDHDDEPPAVILAFKETKKQLVIPKTNAFCLMSMFGKALSNWVDKKVVLFPSTTKMMGKTVDCIRVWGSPHISEDMPLMIPQGMKKPLKMTMHATGAATSPRQQNEQAIASTKESIARGARAPGPQFTLAEPSAIVLEAWSVLGWTREEGHKDMAGYQGDDYPGHLNALIDKANEQGAF